jgi:choloylglycine hydrolase
MPCTAFTLETEDGSRLLARTLDYDDDYGASLISVPGGLAFPLALEAEAEAGAGGEGAVAEGEGPGGTDVLGGGGSLTKLPYALIGMGILHDYNGSKVPHMLDGVNEHGICGVCNEYIGYAHCAGPVLGKVSVAPSLAVLFVLGSCQSLDEVEDAFMHRASLVAAASPAIGTVPPLHYMFTDDSGGCVIVEPDVDRTRVHRDTVGVLTNTPPYPWQETSLRNHLGLLRRERIAPTVVAGKQLTTNSTNANLLGLPGDFTSTSRFIRAACLRELALPAKDETEGVTLAMHILNTLSAVKGWCMPLPSQEEKWLHTVYTSVMCARSRSYYFCHYGDRRLVCARLEDLVADAACPVSYAWSTEQSVLILA